MLQPILLPLVLLGGVIAPSPGEPVGDPVLAAPITADFFCIDCYPCATGHFTGEAGTYGGGRHDDACLSGTCDVVHGVCCCGDPTQDFDLDAALDEARALQQALLAHDAHRLVELLSQESSVVRFVAERSAVQIRNCSGAVVAHFPLPQDVLAVITG